MDSQSITNLLKVLLILLGIGGLIFGIVKAIMAKKEGKGIFSSIARIVGGFLIMLFCIWSNSLIGNEMDKTGEYIFANHPASVNSITYGQAIQHVCSNIEWSRITSKSSNDGHAFAQMNADYIYGNKERRIVIQFDYGITDFAGINESTPFKISFVGFDDESETSVSDMEDIIYNMFELYASDHQIDLDASVKDEILHTN